ncbi:MAG: amino acid ABC transporter substrate-binding protein, partial [Deinococcota bacterium]
MRKVSFALVILCGFASLAFAQSLLNEIQERGSLVCGSNASAPGMGSLNADGEFEGFDIDLCRAVAAAVLGDAGAAEFRTLTSQDRFTAVQTGEVDVLIRNTTWTSSRDSTVGLNFTQTTFYDGQGFLVRADSGIETLADFEGKSICVSPGTTTELNLADTMEALGIDYNAIIIENADQIVTSYDDGVCDSLTNDRSGLVGTRTRLRDPSAHEILDVTISKEPLGPSVLQGDDTWFD